VFQHNDRFLAMKSPTERAVCEVLGHHLLMNFLHHQNFRENYPSSLCVGTQFSAAALIG
jgi:hypothetical protein